jgi:hypothetical protein
MNCGVCGLPITETGTADPAGRPAHIGCFHAHFRRANIIAEIGAAVDDFEKRTGYEGLARGNA